ncbi:ATP/GTP-binding protein [Lentzea cavernae]|uniref:ATP/GTP-binding protein n=1 Tax=Lentzea cavernae TaxID=2020703 RepID=A0ABQ3MY04_9PSEU|nr:ATP/GTP-binding protein [Lentzea cavernae]
MAHPTVLVALAAATFVAASPPVVAGDAWGATTCSQEPSPLCNVTAGTRPNGSLNNGQRPVNGQGQAGDDLFACRYVPAGPRPGQETPKEPGGWFMLLCSPDGKDPDSRGPIWVPAGAAAPSPLTPEQVAQIARKQLRLPAPKIMASPAGDQLVNLHTWMWLDRGSWRDISATASVPGVSVTAVARPTSATWVMGDGSSVTCVGAGSSFPVGGDPTSASPDCGHTYRTSSAGRPAEAFPVAVTVLWAVTWSGAGQGGTFPNLSTSASAAFRVAESQGITTG